MGRDTPPVTLGRAWRFATRRALSEEEAEVWIDGRLQELDPDDRRAGIGDLGPGLDEADYRRRVESIRAYIAAGDCYQVNLTFTRRFAWFGDPLALYAGLRVRQPVRYGGIVRWNGGAVVSLSPELFVERCGARLLTRPMKGTAPRYEAPETLGNSEKDRAENLMIVDLLRNDLGRLAEPGSVRVEKLFEIEAYPTVWQMVSQISARVREGTPETVLRALFPCGSVTGAPKIRAMQIVRELEDGPRGLYTGAFGWIDPAGDLRLNVAIRTLELAADGSGSLGVGSGIVADSDAAAEWQECSLKAAFLTEHDPGVELIETLRAEDGVFPRLAAHLDRLQRSAAWFGFPCDLLAVRAALAAQVGGGLRRVRLTLGKDGVPRASGAELTPEPAGQRWARLASVPVNGDDPLRRHKTTARVLYDHALGELADDPETFDLIFLNLRGEVAEGARSTVFVPRGGVLLTPPVASGALPGVLRGELIATGRAKEAVLAAADLTGEFYLGNALRGLLAVRLRR